MRVFAYGRLYAFPARTWERVLAQHGGKRAKQNAKGAELIVVGAAAASRPPEKLAADLRAFRDAGQPVESERAFLRRIGLIPPLPAEARPFTAADLAARAKTPAAKIDLLALFDVIEGDAGLFGFRALKAAADATRLLDEAGLQKLVFACCRLRENLGVAAPLAELSVATDAQGHVVLRAGGMIAELDGQLRLGLDHASPTVFEGLAEAEEAREAGEDERAIQALRRALAVSRTDLDVLFELGSLLCARDRYPEGMALLRRAIALRPSFADAWYNLGHALEQQDRLDEAVGAYRRAVDADPGYADPFYNLGMLALDAGRFREAIERFTAYLALDPSSEWAGKARKALALARMSLVKAG